MADRPGEEDIAPVVEVLRSDPDGRARAVDGAGWPTIRKRTAMSIGLVANYMAFELLDLRWHRVITPVLTFPPRSRVVRKGLVPHGRRREGTTTSVRID